MHSLLILLEAISCPSYSGLGFEAPILSLSSCLIKSEDLSTNFLLIVRIKSSSDSVDYLRLDRY